MPIDLVLILANDIRQLEKQIHIECQRKQEPYNREQMETINKLIGQLRARYAELVETKPTSVLGAGELIRFAAHRLPFSQGRYATHLYRIADRLTAGQRLPADLIWLRALAEALNDNGQAEGRNNTAALLALAVKGMAHPVVVYRAATPPRAPAHDLGELSRGPSGAPPFVPQHF